MPEINSNEALMTWLMNRFNQKLGDKAILKGGMVLRLLECPRHTNDLDYIFTPFKSKKEVLPLVKGIVDELDGAKVEAQFHSTNLRMIITYGKLQTKIEANVEGECKTEAVSTQLLSGKYNMLPELIKTMSLDWALAHKMAAWNERNLYRDLYDIYYIGSVLGTMPNFDILNQRLGRIQYSRKTKDSGYPKKMTIPELLEKMDASLSHLKLEDLKTELVTALDPEEFPGLDLKIKGGVRRLIDRIRQKLL